MTQLPKKLIETVDLNTTFNTYEGVVKALNNVCITVNHGTTFGLVGESGCGKSVTVRSIMRIIQKPGEVKGGKVLLFLDDDAKKEAVDLLQQSEAYMESLRGDQISMIFQEPNAALNPILTVGDQVAESFLFHRRKGMIKSVLEDLSSPDCKMLPKMLPLIKGILKKIYTIANNNPDTLLLKVMSRIPLIRLWEKPLKKEALKRAGDIIAKLGIPYPEQVVMSYPHNLSGGMKQRIVIAIALACHPMLLIADEATSNLDVTIQAQILELLLELKEKEISSILLITHDLGVVAETCDRVGVMYAGTLCEVADVKDIFTKPHHPYTEALLNSVPKFNQEGDLQSIEGTVPNLITPPSGCRFHPRCPFVMDICKEKAPELYEVGENHTVACYKWAN